MGAGDKIVLWFEPDVYDQLQLLQILARCYIKPAGERPVLTIVASDELLGPLAPDKLAKYADTERTVREVDLELAAAGWEAFTNSEPVLLRNFAGTETELFSANSYAADAAIVLPHVHAAMRRLLQEYPSLANGLSRTEQQIVDVLMSGARTVADTYAAAHAPKEELVWLGDWSFAWYVERMMLARIPLLEFEDGSGMVVGLAQTDHAKFWKNPVRLTEAGKAVALGTSHAIGLNGIDRWIGGVHLAYSNLHDDLRVMLR
jgi:hypothetical protein